MFNSLGYTLQKEVVRIMKHLKRYRKTYKKQRTEIQNKISLVKKMYEEATEFKDSALQTVCLKILKQHFLIDKIKRKYYTNSIYPRESVSITNRT